MSTSPDAMNPIEPSQCPVCGEANGCGLVQGKGECWCFGASIARPALARVPTEARNVACICARCAALATGEEPEPAAP